MEQITQENIQKPAFPIKTKIAAWWMIILGIVYSSYQFLGAYSAHKILKEYGEFMISPLSVVIYPVIFGILFSSLIGIFLLKRKKTAWNFAIITFSITFIETFLGLLLAIIQNKLGSLDKLLTLFLLSTLIPTIFLIIDRKNFWKVAT